MILKSSEQSWECRNWWCLEVEASHDAIRGHAFVVLYKLDAMTQNWGYSFVEISLGEALEEVASSIAKDFWLYDYYAWDGGWGEGDHNCSMFGVNNVKCAMFGVNNVRCVE